ncbi:MAG TPA: phosphopantetheine-binding protein [Candidatus Binataceae bacterium]|nr:phosphopantetheine-binding protein [Candidatus Binataceae bacterium]
MHFSPEDRVVAVVQQVFEERSIDRPVRASENLIDVGLTSLDIVRLVLMVETEFDLMIPLADITPANFRSISAISRLVGQLLSEL